MSRRSSISESSIEETIALIHKGNRVAMGKAITLVESKLTKHQNLGTALLTQMLNKPTNTYRIAISGSPGVGKSTFIETLGLQLVESGHRVAVLTIDPSSEINKGSILGDKTRMERLSIHDAAFIRPSPAGDFLGGVAWRTREAITICEAAGFDTIIIETVGVGQSEFKVREMVDCFCLLLSPGGGDELQGIKKGIVEIADILSINKCDGDLEQIAIHTRKEYAHALHLFPPKANGWSPKVTTTSSETGHGLSEIWKLMIDFKKHVQENGAFQANRKEQNVIWFKDRLTSALYQLIQQKTSTEHFAEIENDIKSGTLNPLIAAESVLKDLV